jgi:DNA replication regulator DPB11
MGAEHVLDLTSEVTHLICGELFSPKYRYVAKNREDVKVMSTKWINSIYRAWIAGDDIDTAYYEKQYRFPVLYGLNISVTGIPDGGFLLRDTCLPSVSVVVGLATVTDGT